MIISSIAERAEFLLKEFGGITEARKTMPEEQIVDITLFNGLTTTVFPFYNKYDPVDTEGYSYLNLYEADYLEDTYISILDYNYNLLYRIKPTYSSVNDVESYYVGITADDKALLQSLKHGSVYFLQYETTVTSKLLQVIISHKLPNTVYVESKAEWLFTINKASTMNNKCNELILKLPNVDVIYGYVLKGQLNNNYREVDVVYNPNNNYNTYNGNEYAYLMIEFNQWLCFRHYRDSNVSLDVNNKTLDNATDYLIDAGYTRLVLKDLANYNNAYVFHKDSTNDYISEVVITIDENQYVKGYTVREFKSLTPSNITGDKSDSITVNQNNTVYINISSVEVGVSSSSLGLTRRGHLNNKTTSYSLNISPIKCTGDLLNA